MANITENRISTTISAADITTIGVAYNSIKPIIEANTLALTDEERSSLFSFDDSNKVFAEEALQEAKNNGTILPQPVQDLIPEMEKDLTLYKQLDEGESLFNDLMNRVKDTKRLTAHEAYKVALTIYTIYEALAKAGVPGAKASYDRLKERFAGQGGRPPQENP